MVWLACLRLGHVEVTLAGNRHNAEGVNVSGFENPIVLVTRPIKGSAAFLKALRQEAGPFDDMIRPAFENIAVKTPIPDFDVAIFTSRSGVDFAPAGQGRTAWCVGDATADAAKLRGYKSHSAKGNAQDLTELILQQAPSGRLLHIRGENSHGNIRDTLTGHGLSCAEAIVYRKDAKSIGQKELADRIGDRTVILPIFSNETVSIIADWPALSARCHVVALSDAVAEAAGRLAPLGVSVAPRPTLASMVQQTARLIA